MFLNCQNRVSITDSNVFHRGCMTCHDGQLLLQIRFCVVSNEPIHRVHKVCSIEVLKVDQQLSSHTPHDSFHICPPIDSLNGTEPRPIRVAPRSAPKNGPPWGSPGLGASSGPGDSGLTDSGISPIRSLSV
eukprot:Gregarina_sp_Poly_1__10925@NODE_856_length_5950_cov_321_945436_g619_i0_p5_GENE_NODE_856_length_5950_cov_321_945436_g619_i0NODE_856_length_5950_cov_321_945436_g619_i0_p5_ORF_typecomplete_len131_score3_60LIM/PF00412_22/0_074_NODE_856_length_5950_cov_321_945436_g619_i053535745